MQSRPCACCACCAIFHPRETVSFTRSLSFIGETEEGRGGLVAHVQTQTLFAFRKGREREEMGALQEHKRDDRESEKELKTPGMGWSSMPQTKTSTSPAAQCVMCFAAQMHPAFEKKRVSKTLTSTTPTTTDRRRRDETTSRGTHRRWGEVVR